MRASVSQALQVCPVEVAIAVAGGSWKLTVVKHLLQGTRRFGELHRLLPLVSIKTLTRQLRALETDGIVQREVFPQVPPKVEYSLTELGFSLAGVVQAMDQWGAEYERSILAD
ncbi:winged helix-turn-helix transcriptional regulator [Psychromicrobium lacuslunae]|uniref:Transcriptional regulator n=1 Tax=Psychromicrobium lacuslunae TaxID=1618207 RepID=A0A0D4C3L5_9MICC|nr:helix-turn-helix domain-containing protein [Psychromicrobium lacuslunae]AJT43124.1 transcriptional regulator [Psychromicrobium lacuslunae]